MTSHAVSGPGDPAIVVTDPDEEEITPEMDNAWSNRRAGSPVDRGVRAADALAETRAPREV
ncbi:MAG: hypothetical protein ACYCO3_07355 [Mycobacteriales bacterium]